VHKSYNIENLDLEDSKIKAITTTEKPLLIIAGPGSGKTMTLVERIVYLIVEKEVNPTEILVSTFTEKAAKELITRVSNRTLELGVSINLNEMYIGTLHSLFLRLLKENREFTRLKRNFKMLDQFDQDYLLYQNLYQFREIDGIELVYGERSPVWTKATTLSKYINKVIEEMVPFKELLNSSESEMVALGKVVEIYSELLTENNVIDFSNIQAETVKLFNNHPEVLEQIQEQIKYVMVDEYQDTNTIQEYLILKLCENHNRLCVVGDDDQGLYRFRGATIRNILEFKKNFEEGECEEVRLSTNFRSHPTIIDFYNEFMEQGDWEDNGVRFRFDKVIKPREGVFPDNPAVIKIEAEENSDLWCERVYNFILNLKEEGKLQDYNQVAFLFNSVKGPDASKLELYLEEKGIPVFNPRSGSYFYRDEIKLLLGALIFILDKDGWLFETLKNNSQVEFKEWEYYKECKTFFAKELRSDKKKHKSLIQFCSGKATELLSLYKNTDYAYSALFYELLKYPLFSSLLDLELNTGVVDLRPTYNFSIFSQLLTKFEFIHNISVFSKKNKERAVANFFNRYLRFLLLGGMSEYEDYDEYAPSGCISFMTIHQSKGLEFPVVIVGSLGTVPRKQYTDLDIMLQDNHYKKAAFEPVEKTKFYDFWRLYYTAFSRPQNLLVLTSNKNSRNPSKYMRDTFEKITPYDSEAFDIRKLNLKEVKPTNIKHQYSFTSHILLYENCPLQYKFYKELEFTPVRNAAMIFGTLVHQTIEDIHKEVLTGNEKNVTEINVQEWFDDNYVSISKSMKSYLAEGQQKAALEQVLAYKSRQEKDWSVVQEAEVDVSLVKDEYILKGTVDLIKGEGDTVEIVDFKSEKKPDLHSDYGKDKIARYKRQLEIYSHLIEERTGKEVSKMHLYYTSEISSNPYYSFDKNTQSIDKTIKKFDDVVDKIETKNYDMSSTVKCDKLCGNCDFRHYCNS